MANMIVAIYKCGDQDIPHWCLASIGDYGEEKVFEANGSAGQTFTYAERSIDLDNSAGLKVRVAIGRVEADIWPETPSLLRSVPISNAPGWNCQNWVMSAINTLRQTGHLEESTQGTAYLNTMYQKKWMDYTGN